MKVTITCKREILVYKAYDGVCIIILVFQMDYMCV